MQLSYKELIPDHSGEATVSTVLGFIHCFGRLGSHGWIHLIQPHSTHVELNSLMTQGKSCQKELACLYYYFICNPSWPGSYIDQAAPALAAISYLCLPSTGTASINLG